MSAARGLLSSSERPCVGNCFGASENPIGAVVQAKGVPLQVVGILDSKGQTSYGQDQDDLIMVPFSTAERKILGVAAPSQAADRCQLDLSAPAQSIRATAALGRVCQSDLRAGSGPDWDSDRHPAID